MPTIIWKHLYLYVVRLLVWTLVWNSCHWLCFPPFGMLLASTIMTRHVFSMYSKSHDFNAYNVAITLPILMLKGFYWIWHYCFRIWMHNQFEHVDLHVKLCLKLKKVNLPIKLCILNIQDWCIGIMTFDHQQVPF